MLEHRVIFAMHYGRWVESLDHESTDKSNNRPDNLRDCTHLQNMKNQGARKGKASTLKGAYFHKRIGRWQSAICVNYKQIHLGFFDTEAEAHEAYKGASAKYHGRFGRVA